MILPSNKNIEKYFLTKSSSIRTSSKVDIVLSPEFYWTRIFEIPVDNIKKANNYLPTLFEDILPSAQYEYFCIKQDKKKYMSFAFNNEDILNYIKQSGLMLTQINAIYFAQTQMQSYDSFIIDDKAFMYDKDILIKVPKSFCETSNKLSNKINNSIQENKVNFKFYNNVISSKYIYTFIILLGFITFINIFKVADYGWEISNNNKNLEKLKVDNKLPKTMFQMNSIYKSMQNKSQQNSNFKKTLLYILNYKKSIKEGSIEKVTFKNKTINVLFKNINENTIKTYLKKEIKINSFNKTGHFLSIEVKI